MKRIVFVLSFLFVAGLGFSAFAAEVNVDNTSNIVVVDLDNDKKPTPEGDKKGECSKEKKAECKDAKAKGECAKKSAEAKKGCAKKSAAKEPCCEKKGSTTASKK